MTFALERCQVQLTATDPETGDRLLLDLGNFADLESSWEFEVGDRVQANYECLNEACQEDLIITGRLWLDEISVEHLELSVAVQSGWNYVCRPVTGGWGDGVYGQNVLTGVL